LRNHKDTRGRSYYDLFESQQGQTDISYNYPGTIRAFHQHLKKDETWVCVRGDFKVVLSDPLDTIYLSEGERVLIERGRWHGFQVLGADLAIMLEFTTEKHDEDNLDDYRKPYNAFDEWETEKK